MNTFEVEGLFISRMMEQRISHRETVGDPDRPDSPAVEGFGPRAPGTTSEQTLFFPLVSVHPLAHFYDAGLVGNYNLVQILHCFFTSTE